MTGGDGTTSNFSSTAALQHKRVDNDNGSGGGEAGRDVLAEEDSEPEDTVKQLQYHD